MSIPVLPFLTSTYSRNIMWGNERLTERDGHGGVKEGYYIPVETYIAQHYTDAKIEEAFTNGFLSQQEHDEIMKLKETVQMLDILE